MGKSFSSCAWKDGIWIRFTLTIERCNSCTAALHLQRSREDQPGITSSHSGRKWRLWSIPFRRVKTLEHCGSGSANEEVFVDSDPGLQNSDVTPTWQLDIELPPGIESFRKQLLRTNVPPTEKIASLNLKDGQNMIAFTFSTRVLGAQTVDAHVYLWKWNARIVISDVDGIVTKNIKQLFPSDYNPFYGGGFGNRDTDEQSYRKIGIPKGKIFKINPKGEVVISHRIDVKSYTSLHTLVNHISLAGTKKLNSQV